MRHLKYIFPILFIAFSFASHAQDSKSFLLEVQNNDFKPTLSVATGNYTIDSTLLNAQDINQQFSDIVLTDAIDVNRIDTDESKQLVLISTENTNHTRVYAILDYLVNSYTDYMGYTEITIYSTLVTTPDDFENASSVYITDPSQDDLKMIRAQEAWDLTTGNPDVIIGIADNGFYVPHDELTTEIIGGIGSYETPAGSSGNWNIGKHGTKVADYASGATNNGKGSSSIGYDTKMIAMRQLSVNALKLLSDMGAKVVNGSFGSPTTRTNLDQSQNPDVNQQRIYDMIDNGTVVVVAAGNGPKSGNDTTDLNGVISNESYASRYYLPASYQHVISVSTVGNKNDIGSTSVAYDNWKGVHRIATSTAYPNGAGNYNSSGIPINEPFLTWQHNDSIDIVVPAYFTSPYALNNNTPNYNYAQQNSLAGTSFSAPIVSGTVGLMFSVNYCLQPKEVESILKLTAVKIDNLPENLPYYGKLGAGMLDAYESVKMSKDMADEFGTVEVKDRVLYRWFYKLETAPYEIKMTNNDVTGNARLKFKARNNIEILSGDYYPETGGYIDLSIDSALSLDNCPPPASLARTVATNKFSSPSPTGSNYRVYPTLVDKNIIIEKLDDRNIQDLTIKIFDFYGHLVFEDSNIKDLKTLLNVEKLIPGIHIVKIYDVNNIELETLKIVKK